MLALQQNKLNRASKNNISEQYYLIKYRKSVVYRRAMKNMLALMFNFVLVHQYCMHQYWFYTIIGKNSSCLATKFQYCQVAQKSIILKWLLCCLNECYYIFFSNGIFSKETKISGTVCPMDLVSHQQQFTEQGSETVIIFV